MKRVLSFAALLAAPLVGFALVTALALEGREVVILHTSTANGMERTTRAWIAEDRAGRLWLEANNDQSPWLLDVMTNGSIRLERAGKESSWRALPDPSPPARARVRFLMAAKYGWADAWVGRFFGSPHSVAVRLVPSRPLSGTKPG
jgi:hypothetical protein